MRRWRPDRSHVLLVLACALTTLGVAQSLVPPHDYGLLGAAAPLWMAWATMDREVQRRQAQRRRRRRRPPAEKEDKS